MKRPKMIGAHVPKKPTTRAPRCRLNETAQMIAAAYDRFARQRQRTHIAYQPAQFGS